MVLPGLAVSTLRAVSLLAMCVPNPVPKSVPKNSTALDGLK